MKTVKKYVLGISAKKRGFTKYNENIEYRDLIQSRPSLSMPKNDPQFDGYITLKEAAKISGYSADYIGQLIRKGKIHGRQVYTNIAWVTTEEDLRAYLSGEKSPAENEGTEPAPSEKPLELSQGLLAAFRVMLWVFLALSILAALFVLFALVTSSDRLVTLRGGELAQHTASHIASQPSPYVLP